MEDENIAQDNADFLKEKANCYVFLGKQDRHLVRLFHWINLLDDFAKEIAACEQDKELEIQIINIRNRLKNEMGERMIGIFP